MQRTLHMAPPGVKYTGADARLDESHGVASQGASGIRPPQDAAAAACGRLFAVIGLGGTQYKVTPGDIINAEHIRGAEVGATMAISDVLAVGSAGVSVLGRPVVPGALVRCVVEEQTLDRKVIVFKKKRRKRYQRTHGHRRMVTRLRVESIECGEAGGTFSRSEAEAAAASSEEPPPAAAAPLR